MFEAYSPSSQLQALLVQPRIELKHLGKGSKVGTGAKRGFCFDITRLGPGCSARRHGGGTKGGLWTQVISDFTVISQELPEQTIDAGYGDAKLAGIACGLVKADVEWSSISSTVEPNPENREVYEELYSVYRNLYPAARAVVHTLAGMQTGGRP
jgi:hypothetical protein